MKTYKRKQIRQHENKNTNQYGHKTQHTLMDEEATGGPTVDLGCHLVAF